MVVNVFEVLLLRSDQMCSVMKNTFYIHPVWWVYLPAEYYVTHTVYHTCDGSLNTGILFTWM